MIKIKAYLKKARNNYILLIAMLDCLDTRSIEIINFMSIDLMIKLLGWFFIFLFKDLIDESSSL
jgi:hypothetical protein